MSEDLARLVVETHKRAAGFANDMRQPWPCDNETGEATDDSIEPPPTKPMTDARLDEIQEMISDWEGHPEEGDATCELLAEVDYQRAENARLRAERDPDGDLCIENGNLRAEVDRQADEMADLRLNLEGWQRTAAEATELLDQHVRDWGECDPYDEPCMCSHARALRFLAREGATDDNGQDEEPDDCEHCEGTGECQEAHPCGYDHSCAVCGGTGESEGVVAQQESAPETSGTSAGSSPAHPHPNIAALRKQAAAEGAQAIPALLAAIDQLQTERDDIDRGAIAEGATQRATIWRLTSENEQLWAERARLREVHTGIRRLITAWESQPPTHRIHTTGAARILREILGGEDVAFADEPAELTADHTLRTAAGQEASDA